MAAETARGFAVFAGIAPEIIRASAREAEARGFASFWVNHPGPVDGLGALAQAGAETQRIDLGVGVIPLHTRGPEDIVAGVRQHRLAPTRLLLGIGSPNPQALRRVREGVAAIRKGLQTRIIVAALGPSLATIIVVLGLTGWERYTRVVRAEVLALREKDFVEAARAIGASPVRTLLRHLLPNTFSSIIVMSTLQVAQAILQEAALSFLGVGTGNVYPTWGQMIALGRDFVSVAWWLPTFPGLAILLTVLAINLVGDRLRDALDPRVT
jgi:hypothetical protein